MKSTSSILAATLVLALASLSTSPSAVFAQDAKPDANSGSTPAAAPTPPKEIVFDDAFRALYQEACAALDIATNPKMGEGVNFEKRVVGPQEFEIPLAANYIDKPIDNAEVTAQTALAPMTSREALALIGMDVPKSEAAGKTLNDLYNEAALRIIPARKVTTVEEVWDKEVLVSQDQFDLLEDKEEAKVRKALIVFSDYNRRMKEAWATLQKHDPKAPAAIAKMLQGMVEDKEGATREERIFATKAFLTREGLSEEGSRAMQTFVTLLADAEIVMRTIEPVFQPLTTLKQWWRSGSISLKGAEIRIGGAWADNHELSGNEALVIDIGGDDNYSGYICDADIGHPLKVIIDFGGNDNYRRSKDAKGMASGHCGFGWLLDKGGNDYYEAGDFSLGAGCFGIGILEDLGGEDTYIGGQLTQGAGYVGVGMLIDQGVLDKVNEDTSEKRSNDTYKCDRFGQGFGFVAGYGVLRDIGGNDTYNAGGRYRHTPLLPDAFQSLSQGFGFGSRGLNFAGGIGVLDDQGSGNDVYNAEVYGQGASYWYSLGVLRDGGGNDRYTLTQYGQGAGIHLSGGMLIDEGGNDCYYNFNGVGTGGAHDYAVGILVDKGGDDAYYSNGIGQGLNNAVALLYDAAGNDTYASRGPDGIGLGQNMSIAFLIDGGGKDNYSTPMQDGLWAFRGDCGVIVDHMDAKEWATNRPALRVTREFLPKQAPIEEGKSASPEAKPARPDPVVGADNQKRDQAALEALWARACDWQVGTDENKLEITNARRTLVEEGNLEFLLTKLEASEPLIMRALHATIPYYGAAAIEGLLKQIGDPKKPWSSRNAFDLITLIYGRQLKNDPEGAAKHLQETAPKMVAAFEKLDESSRFSMVAFLNRYNAEIPTGEKAAIEIMPLLKPYFNSDKDRTRLAAVRLAVTLPPTPELFAALQIAAFTDSYHAVRLVAERVKMPTFESAESMVEFARSVVRLVGSGMGEEERARTVATITQARGLLHFSGLNIGTESKYAASAQFDYLLRNSAQDSGSPRGFLKAAMLFEGDEVTLSEHAKELLVRTRKAMTDGIKYSAASCGAFAALYAKVGHLLAD